MKCSKNAATLLLLVLFTTGQREEEIFEKYYLWVQALKKGEKLWILGILYPNIYRILKFNFQ